ncbi:MAG: allophanate hydrolase, partial [Rhodospirillaceae bacterium]|nr:allophanate hydrolase [Rhodospirillaceae bacterium]MBT3929420.1 allophanate hydrolase [Rhodospirillaceae bacterium]
MNFDTLRDRYLQSPGDVDKVARETLARLRENDDGNIWIARVSDEAVLADAKRLATFDPKELPLFGIPFAVKDNIDVAGMPTTAGCPEFAYTPEISSPVVDRLIAA